MIQDDFNQGYVTVSKAELLESIRNNRDGHRKKFIQAQMDYRTAVVAELDGMLKDAREGKKIRRSVSFPEPSDHTNDYDRVIRMLEMSVAETIQISGAQFEQFVMDRWNWSNQFEATIGMYRGE